MDSQLLSNIHVLQNTDDPLFNQREEGTTHTSYFEETAFLTLIQQGNTHLVKQMLGKFIESGIVVGRLSDDPLRQMQYWAVCCITLGTRYAIQGGLDEMTAYNLADNCIHHIDSLTDVGEIAAYITEKVIEVTELVHKSVRSGCPLPVRKCLNYIENHLHETIRMSDLADLCDLSEDYLSRIFKKYVGQNVRSFIMQKKLETAKAMLRSEYDQKMIAYYLGFCSQTYFITCFKKAYGITPHKYAAGYDS